MKAADMRSSRPRKRSISIATVLVLFGLGTLLPVFMVGMSGAFWLANRERTRLAIEAQDSAKQLIGAIDRELDGMIASLQVLATSPSLAADDFGAFYGQAKQVLSFRGTAVAMRDGSGQQLVNTYVPWGTTLPVSTDPVLRAADQLAMQSKKPVVSDIYIGAVAKAPFVLVDVPVLIDGEARYALNMAISPDALVKILQEMRAPADWNLALIDGKHRVIARSREQERFVGRPATDAFRTNVEAGRTTWRGVTLDGVDVLTVTEKSGLSAWRVVVSVPTRELEAPFRSLLTAVLGVIALGLLVSVGLGFGIGRRLAGTVQNLAAAATSLGRARTATLPNSLIREVNDISVALQMADLDLSEGARQRDEALQAARAQERRLLATYENAGVGIAEIDVEGRFIAVNETLCRITGYSRDELLNMTFAELSDPDDVAADLIDFSRQKTGEQQDYAVEKRFRRRDGVARWARIFSTSVQEDGAFAYAVRVVLDITDEVDAAAHQNLLIAELNHRVKNTLAIVQSLVLQTLRGAKSPEDFRSAMTGRIMALARSHELLSDTNWRGTTLGQLMRVSLAALDGADLPRVSLAGDTISVGRSAVVSMTLLVHELATNALKYGGLSDEAGRLEVAWAVQDHEQGQQLSISWQESWPARPLVQGALGFGTRLISTIVEREFGGHFHCDLGTGSARHDFSIPLPAISK